MTTDTTVNLPGPGTLQCIFLVLFAGACSRRRAGFTRIAATAALPGERPEDARSPVMIDLEATTAGLPLTSPHLSSQHAIGFYGS